MADVIRTRRVALGLSQAELDARAGAGAGSVADFELGEGAEPTREAALRIADALGLSLEELTADDTTRLRRRWLIERAFGIAIETDGVNTIRSAGDEHRATFLLPREPSGTVRQRLRALGAEYGLDVEVRVDPDVRSPDTAVPVADGATSGLAAPRDHARPVRVGEMNL